MFKLLERLYGVSTILVFLYFTNYPDDWRFQKIAVRFLVHLLGLVHQNPQQVAILWWAFLFQNMNLIQRYSEGCWILCTFH
jgi:hypothetical protein